MNQIKIKEGIEALTNIYNKNGNTNLIGYFPSGLQDMKLNKEGKLEFTCMAEKNELETKTEGIILKDTIIMKQIQKNEQETTYNIISWTRDGDNCTAVIFNSEEEMNKVYMGIKDIYKLFICKENIDSIFSGMRVDPNSVIYTKYNANINANVNNKETAASLVDDSEKENNEVNEFSNFQMY